MDFYAVCLVSSARDLANSAEAVSSLCMGCVCVGCCFSRHSGQSDSKVCPEIDFFLCHSYSNFFAMSFFYNNSVIQMQFVISFRDCCAFVYFLCLV